MKNKDKIRGALLGVAVGDALGVSVEFMSSEEIKRLHGKLTEIIGGGWLNAAPGEVSDDTQMTLAVAEGIAANPENPIPSIGELFIKWYETMPKNIGNTCKEAISRAKSKTDGSSLNLSGKDWHAAAEEAAKTLGGKNAGNGALMRTVYPGLYYGRQGVKMAEDIAKMTHCAAESTEACRLYTQMIAVLIEDGNIQDIQKILQGTRYQNRAQILKPTGYVVDSMECALSCLFRNSTFEDAVTDAVNLGGDADTIGAITGGLAGALYGAAAVPNRWTEKLPLKIRQQIDMLTDTAFNARK